jgi:hypothetical protein
VRAFPRWAGCVITGIVMLTCAACGVTGPPSAGPTSHTRRPPPVALAQPRGPSTVRQPMPQKLRAVERPFLPSKQKPAVPRPSPRKLKVTVPQPDHIVVVILENKHYSNVIGTGQAPYLNKLADRGATMTHSYGVTHPSQPNYLALFSGSTHGVRSNACPQHLGNADNLGHQLRKSGRSFVGYAESLPKTGFRGCGSGRYLRKHNPWVNFDTLPASTNQPFTAFPSDYRKLPTVSFVSPNMCHDMHDCSIRTGDHWMKKHFRRYARWAPGHNSLLVVTFDENAGGTAHSIPTIIVGANVRAGVYAERVDHYGLLRTIEDAYGLTPLRRAKDASPLSKIWIR